MFGCIYFRNYDAASILILATFFAFFMSLRRSDGAANLFAAVGSPVLELAKALGCLIAGGAFAGAAGFLISQTQLTVSVSLTAVVVGVVGFVVFLIRAVAGWMLARDRRH